MVAGSSPVIPTKFQSQFIDFNKLAFLCTDENFMIHLLKLVRCFLEQVNHYSIWQSIHISLPTSRRCYAAGL